MDTNNFDTIVKRSLDIREKYHQLEIKATEKNGHWKKMHLHILPMPVGREECNVPSEKHG